MVHVGHVRMRVAQRRVSMRMAVRALRHRVMRVIEQVIVVVMPVVVGVRMLVIE